MLSDRQEAFRKRIAEGYEHAAMSCLTCTTPGACCLDAHFVNVRISRLEAVAIDRVIGEMPVDLKRTVEERIYETIEKYGLSDVGDTHSQTYACPLYDRRKGCLVHQTGKPLPCLHHACYENDTELPPADLLDAEELAVERLNVRTYGSPQPRLPLPLALKRWIKSAGSSG